MSSKSYPYSEYPFNFWDLATGRKLKSDPKFSAQTDSALDHQISNAFVSDNWTLLKAFSSPTFRERPTNLPLQTASIRYLVELLLRAEIQLNTKSVVYRLALI